MLIYFLVRKAILPSFSTAGFGRASLAQATPKRLEVVSISSDSTPSSPTRNIKRMSSDLSFASDLSPPSKRPRKDLSAEKENALRTEYKPQSKGKSKAPLIPHSQVPRPRSDGEEPWMKMQLDPERNPFTKLERDFPTHVTSPLSVGLDIPDQDSDLLLVGSRALESLHISRLTD